MGLYRLWSLLCRTICPTIVSCSTRVSILRWSLGHRVWHILGLRIRPTTCFTLCGMHWGSLLELCESFLLPTGLLSRFLWLFQLSRVVVCAACRGWGSWQRYSSCPPWYSLAISTWLGLARPFPCWLSLSSHVSLWRIAGSYLRGAFLRTPTDLLSWCLPLGSTATPCLGQYTSPGEVLLLAPFSTKIVS